MPDLQPPDPDYQVRVRERFAPQTVMHTLGIEMVRLGPGTVDLAMDCREDLIQQHGFLLDAAQQVLA